MIQGVTIFKYPLLSTTSAEQKKSSKRRINLHLELSQLTDLKTKHLTLRHFCAFLAQYSCK